MWCRSVLSFNNDLLICACEEGLTEVHITVKCSLSTEMAINRECIMYICTSAVCDRQFKTFWQDRVGWTQHITAGLDEAWFIVAVLLLLTLALEVTIPWVASTCQSYITWAPGAAVLHQPGCSLDINLPVKTSDSLIKLLFNERTWTNWSKNEMNVSDQSWSHGAVSRMLSVVLNRHCCPWCWQPHSHAWLPLSRCSAHKALFNTLCKLFADVIDRVISSSQGESHPALQHMSPAPASLIHSHATCRVHSKARSWTRWKIVFVPVTWTDSLDTVTLDAP